MFLPFKAFGADKILAENNLADGGTHLTSNVVLKILNFSEKENIFKNILL
jgi:hypothetical protein